MWESAPEVGIRIQVNSTGVAISNQPFALIRQLACVDTSLLAAHF
jgi:hypothetical protein